MNISTIDDIAEVIEVPFAEEAVSVDEQKRDEKGNDRKQRVAKVA